MTGLTSISGGGGPLWWRVVLISWRCISLRRDGDNGRAFFRSKRDLWHQQVGTVVVARGGLAKEHLQRVIVAQWHIEATSQHLERVARLWGESHLFAQRTL